MRSGIRPERNRGAVIIMVTAMLIVLIGFGSLGVDLGYIWVIRNQLQNAADAGALAAARNLYVDGGTTVNESSNQIGTDAAQENDSQNQPVEVLDPLSNSGDVQRGHWSFATRTFTPNTSLAQVDLSNVTAAELDANTDFINAVRVRTRRQNIPAKSFLAPVLGYDSFEVGAEAIAYLGFAGTLEPFTVEQPIAICEQSITQGDDEFTCSTGRMIDSGGGTTTNSAAWTNFSQPCETASVPTVRPLVCGSGNEPSLTLGDGMGSTGGMQDSVYRQLQDCWEAFPLAEGQPVSADGKPLTEWELLLPVIDCPSNNPGPCSPLLGAVTVRVLWVKDSGADPDWSDIPLQMEDWICPEAQAFVDTSPDYATVAELPTSALSEADRIQCWSGPNGFASTFNLQTSDGTSVGDLTHSDVQKTMFFLPDCSPHVPTGVTGGQNFGILAEIPVLVD